MDGEILMVSDARSYGPLAFGPLSETGLDTGGFACAESDALRTGLGDSDFFTEKSIRELAREQDVGPVKDIRIFAGVIPDDEDVDEMLDEIYRLREP